MIKDMGLIKSFFKNSWSSYGREGSQGVLRVGPIEVLGYIAREIKFTRGVA